MYFQHLFLCIKHYQLVPGASSFEVADIYFHVYVGANVSLKDHLGRNFLHLTVLQPGGLQHLNEKFLQVQYALIYISQLPSLGNVKKKTTTFLISNVSRSFWCLLSC